MNKFKVELCCRPYHFQLSGLKFLVGGAKAGFRVEFKGTTEKVCKLILLLLLFLK